MSSKVLRNKRNQKGVQIKTDYNGDVSTVKIKYKMQKSQKEQLNGQFVVLYDLQREETGRCSRKQRLQSYDN